MQNMKTTYIEQKQLEKKKEINICGDLNGALTGMQNMMK